MSGLDALVIAKLGKLIPRLATNHDGEALATARAILRTLEAAGADLHDVVVALSKPPVERVVYRERVIIVYRDPPALAPEFNFDLGYEEVCASAALLLDPALCNLNAKEADFAGNMRDLAERYQDDFRMSEKQAAWFRKLVNERLGGMVDGGVA